MSNCIDPSVNLRRQGGVTEPNPSGSGYSSAPAGMFSLRRARYFNDTRSDAALRRLRSADFAGSTGATKLESSSDLEMAFQESYIY